MASISTALVGLNAQPVAPSPVGGATADPVMVVNLDEVNTVYLGSTASQVTLPLPPQASVTLIPPVWASAPARLTVGVIPGGTAWTNPVGVQIALDALGLATADLQTSQMTVGIPPNVPAITAMDALNKAPGDSPVTVYTFTAPGRVWGVELSLTAAASAAFSGGWNRIFAVAQIDNTTPLAAIELALNAADQIANDTVYVPFNGLAVAQGQPLVLNINGGTAVSLSTIIASVVFYHSIP